MTSKPVEIIPVETAKPGSHAATLIFHNQDHTLGNVLVHYLQNDKNVEFSGYSIPHPSEPKMNLRVQTYDEYPEACVVSSLGKIKTTLSVISEQFKRSLNEYNNVN